MFDNGEISYTGNKDEVEDEPVNVDKFKMIEGSETNPQVGSVY